MAIGFVQLVGSAGQSTPFITTISITVPAGGCALGNTLIVRYGCNLVTAVVSGSDSRGNTYTVDREHVGAAQNYAAILSTQITTALQSGDTITMTLAAATSRRVMHVEEYSGLVTVTPVDQENSAVAASAAPNSGNITTTQADELLAGYVLLSNTSPEATFTEDSPWTLGTPAETEAAAVIARKIFPLRRIVSATGTYAASGSLTASKTWITLIVSYKAVLAAASPNPQFRVIGFIG